jgi:hypothetical protein
LPLQESFATRPATRRAIALAWIRACPRKPRHARAGRIGGVGSPPGPDACSSSQAGVGGAPAEKLAHRACESDVHRAFGRTGRGRCSCCCRVKEYCSSPAARDTTVLNGAAVAARAVRVADARPREAYLRRARSSCGSGAQTGSASPRLRSPSGVFRRTHRRLLSRARCCQSHLTGSMVEPL